MQLFKRLWKLISHQDVAPTATQEGRSWHEVLTAAALRGAIFGLVTAAIDRGGAVGFQRATGAWPGDKQVSRIPTSVDNAWERREPGRGSNRRFQGLGLCPTGYCLCCALCSQGREDRLPKGVTRRQA